MKKTLVQEFGRKCFDNCLTINFEKQSVYCSVFDYDLDVNRIIQEIERLSNTRIIPGRTLLFFDEIQACPRAVTSLKYFCEDRKDLHVIAAGSLPGAA